MSTFQRIKGLRSARQWDSVLFKLFKLQEETQDISLLSSSVPRKSKIRISAKAMYQLSGVSFFSFKLLANTLSYPAVLTTQRAATNMVHLKIQLTTCLYKSNHKCQSLGFSVSIKLKAVSSSTIQLIHSYVQFAPYNPEKLQPQSSFILLTMPAHMWSKQCTVHAPWWILPSIQSLVKQPRLNLKNCIISESQKSRFLGWHTSF